MFFFHQLTVGLAIFQNILLNDLQLHLLWQMYNKYNIIMQKKKKKLLQLVVFLLLLSQRIFYVWIILKFAQMLK